MITSEKPLYLNLQAICKEIILWCFAKWVACFIPEEKFPLSPLLCLLLLLTEPQYFKHSPLKYCLLSLPPDPHL